MDGFLAFGLLPGWWLSDEPEREWSPSLTVSMWDRVLQETNFTGIDAHVRDCEDDEFYNFSVMTSTATAIAPK
ncbi:hypothetical protein F5Y15DRAFT_377652 [Xylariaceae sp. FL0016]|nr:hypothetical protein F5Y15DRAFT_377652 [Xylariaceae sp. FL0016]